MSAAAVKKGLAWTGIVIAGLIVVMLAMVLWVLNTQSGTRWAAARATAALGDKLSIETVDGTIAGPLRLTNLRYRDSAAGIDVRVLERQSRMIRAISPELERNLSLKSRYNSASANVAGVVPLIEAVYAKGLGLGTAMSFMMSIVALSLPAMIHDSPAEDVYSAAVGSVTIVKASSAYTLSMEVPAALAMSCRE